MLSRPPKSGEYIINKNTKIVSRLNTDWSDNSFQEYKHLYNFCTVVEEEGPKDVYLNLYMRGVNKTLENGSGSPSRQTADERVESMMKAGLRRVACLNLAKYIGVYDE